MAITATQQRDANRQVITSNEAFVRESTWTFAAATTGATGAHTVFTVTGNVLVTVFGICDTDLTSGGAAKVEMGVTGNTTGLIAQTTATTIDNGDIWVDASAAVGVEALPGAFILNDGNDIILTISDATVTAGVIDFYCLWRPLSSGADITVTTPA
jgi:hypothetical protein